MKLITKCEFIRGAAAGSLGAAVICLTFEVLEIFKLAKHCWLFLAGQAVMQFNHTLWQAILAAIIHLGVGAFWGVAIAFLYSKVFSDKHYILKGLLIGLAIFFLHFGLLDKVLHYPPEIRRETPTLFFVFLSYLLYGGLTSFIIKKLT